MSEPRPERSREEYERGPPAPHVPTAGFGGAPPAQSALTLRLVLAGFGLVVCVASGIVLLVAGAPVWIARGPVWVAAARCWLPPIPVVALVVVARRKARGEPG